MKSRFDLRVLDRSSALSTQSPARRQTTPTIRFWIVVAMALVLMYLASGQLLAQQGWPQPNPYVSQQAYPYNGQYGAQPQYRYAQPQYQQPQYQQPQYQQPQDEAQLPFEDSSQPYPQPGTMQAQPLDADQIEQLVAPIALYPDALLAQVLAASTYPAQVAAADRWLRVQGNAPPEQIAAGADAQSNWDPSIKALTAFPQVLAQMDRNLQWTTSLGNAYYNQPQDVMQTIQVMRQRAEDAGNLRNTPQEQVSNNQGYIDINPPDPQQVYVPSYNPWDVYGQPVTPYPGFSLLGALGSFFGSSPVQYGLSFALSAFERTPWGFLGWGLDWLSHSILFNHGNYYSHSTSVADWGFPHGGPRGYPHAYPERAGIGRSAGNYGWQHGNYNREGNGYDRAGGQAYARPEQRYGDARTAEGFNRGSQPYGNAYGRTALPQQAYNHMPQVYGRSQQYARPGYGSGTYNRPAETYGGYGRAYGSPSQSYRPPPSSYRGEEFAGRSNGSFGNNYARPEHSGGGFHLFGHGGSQKNDYGGRAPKSYGNRGFGGFGGGKAPKGPKASHFGGGHSGGGHSGGHGGGGHHH